MVGVAVVGAVVIRFAAVAAGFFMAGWMACFLSAVMASKGITLRRPITVDDDYDVLDLSERHI